MQQIDASLLAVEKKQETVATTIEKHSQQTGEIKDELERLKIAPRPQPVPAAATSASSESTWLPRLVHVRGWAPCGASMMQKISKTHPTELQATLRARSPHEVAQRGRWLQPVLANHSVTLDPDERTAKMIADKQDLSLTSDPININGARRHRDAATTKGTPTSSVRQQGLRRIPQQGRRGMLRQGHWGLGQDRPRPRRFPGPEHGHMDLQSNRSQDSTGTKAVHGLAGDRRRGGEQ